VISVDEPLGRTVGGSQAKPRHRQRLALQRIQYLLGKIGKAKKLPVVPSVLLSQWLPSLQILPQSIGRQSQQDMTSNSPFWKSQEKVIRRFSAVSYSKLP